jgi:error-prone DNA polymerase
MPDLPHPKSRDHPAKRPPPLTMAKPVVVEAGSMTPQYIELQTTSCFTFLTGASQPDELVQHAALMGHQAIAITDTNTLAGIVRAYSAGKQMAFRVIVGCQLLFQNPEDFRLLVYPTSKVGYANLCNLLTLGKRRAPKGQCHLNIHDLLARHHDLVAVVPVPTVQDEGFLQALDGIATLFDQDRLSLGFSLHYTHDQAETIQRMRMLAGHTGLPLVALNDVHYHIPGRKPLEDVLTCIREGCTIDQAGYALFLNAERHLKHASEMARLFAAVPDAIGRSLHIAHQTAGFSLDQLRYQYPDEVVPAGKTAISHLTDITWEGARERYPAGIPEKVQALLNKELGLINELNYAPYFLTVQDIAAFARNKAILHQGRGAAANSAVCYCLGVTAVDPDHSEMLFERFISRERNEPPDIDIDFEHERREEVIQYLYNKYGRHRAALTGVIISYRTRSAIRDVGKALGLSLDVVDKLAKGNEWFHPKGLRESTLLSLGLDPQSPTLKHLARLVGEILGFPRHLSQHVGGFVITQGPLSDLVPIENAAMEDRTVIEWDKDDIDAMGMMKVDILGLGMLTCIRKTFDEIKQHEGKTLTLATIPQDDPATYDMICDADTVGVFQIESRAQMSMLPRLKPKTYYDLVIQVAIVRPGPIQGDMVHPYLRRRDGLEAFSYPSPEVEHVLGRTLGVPLFQEQAMAMAIVAAGFTPGEADQLRRAIGAWKTKQKVIYTFGQKLTSGMIANGYTLEFAEQCFNQIKGFSEYGFPESHAASFALLAYASSWLKCHHPIAFACALINSQPMGFYAPAQIVADVKNHGGEVRPVDVHHSAWDCILEPSRGTPTLRLGMRLTKGLAQAEAAKIVQAVLDHGHFKSIDHLRRFSGVKAATLRALARADAFGSMGLDRQHALWQALAIKDVDAPLFDQTASTRPDSTVELPTLLPAIPGPQKVIDDYASTGLSLKAHPMSFIRENLSWRQVVPARHLADALVTPAGQVVRVAGMVLVRQRPGTASGVVFITLEDETGIANLIIWPDIFDQHQRVLCHAGALIAQGKLQREGKVVHVIPTSFESLDADLAGVHTRARDFR